MLIQLVIDLATFCYAERCYKGMRLQYTHHVLCLRGKGLRVHIHDSGSSAHFFVAFPSKRLFQYFNILGICLQGHPHS